MLSNVTCEGKLLNILYKQMVFLQYESAGAAEVAMVYGRTFHIGHSGISWSMM